jgi:hypothetical protein
VKKKIFRFGKGLIDGLLFGVPSAVKNSTASPDNGEGVKDYSKNLGYITAIIITASVAFGAIEVETAEKLFKLLTKFSFWG